MNKQIFSDENGKELYILSQRSYVFTILWAICIYDDNKYGVEELYDQLPRPKPSTSTFRSVLQELERSGLIKISVSQTKKSKKIISLNLKLKKYKSRICDLF